MGMASCSYSYLYFIVDNSILASLAFRGVGFFVFGNNNSESARLRNHRHPDTRCFDRLLVLFMLWIMGFFH